MTLSEIDEAYHALCGQKKLLTATLKSEKIKLADITQQLIDLEEAKEIVREVGKKTQSELQYHISDITSMALDSIFPDPYDLQVEFVSRRNKTECDIYFTRNGEKIDPLDGSGGGAVDVAAFALRIASWSLQHPHTRPLIILDEPMRFVSEDLQEKASLMIKELSKRLGIQFIIITHEQSLTIHADKIIEVSNVKGVSKIK